MQARQLTPPDQVRPLLQAAALETTPLRLVSDSRAEREVCACLVHHYGGANRPFVALACSLVPAQLAEVMLFGRPERAGYVECADGGTLYLDEPDALPAGVQDRLQRLCATAGFERTGETQTRRARVRLILGSPFRSPRATRKPRPETGLLAGREVILAGPEAAAV